MDRSPGAAKGVASAVVRFGQGGEILEVHLRHEECLLTEDEERRDICVPKICGDIIPRSRESGDLDQTLNLKLGLRAPWAE